MATPRIEEYLETIYALESEGASVISARVADRMRVSAPTMTDTVKRLADQGYVAVGPGREISLTEKGREMAETLVRRHRLSERWLTDVLGMDWSTAHQEACKLEHALSPEVEERLARVLDNPSTCPHGNPIPRSGHERVEGLVSLDRVKAADRVTVARVSQTAEEDAEFLDYLQRNEVIPGSELQVVEVSPSAGIVTVTRGDRRLSLGLRAASRIWVRVSG